MQKADQHINTRFENLHDRELYVACSGGLDSICLTHMLHSQNLNVHVIHVNYQLRGEDSDKDTQFVESFCAQRNIPFRKRVVNLAEQLKDGGNLQEKARDYRYAWFHEILSFNEKNAILLAHHADDQIETFFLNLSRKSGVMGLACMPYEHNGIFRPLLHLSKSDLLEYARTHDLQWHEDSSNASSKYRRNLLRNEILPVLTKQIDRLDESVLLLIQKFQQKQTELENAIHIVVEAVHTNNTMPIETLQAMDEFECIEFVRQLKQPASVAHALKKLLTAQKGKKVVLLPNERYTSVVREQSELSFILRISETQKAKLHIESVQELPTEFSKDELYLDADLIQGDLNIRTWQLGDRMAPIGMLGTKLISDIIAEARIPAAEKKHILVLHDDTTIHWCVGLKVGAKATASPTSKQILRCFVTYSESQE